MRLTHKAHVQFKEYTWQEILSCCKEISGKPSHVIRYAVYDFLSKYENNEAFKRNIKRNIKNKVKSMDKNYDSESESNMQSKELDMFEKDYYKDGSFCFISDMEQQEFPVNTERFNETIKACHKLNCKSMRMGSRYIIMHMPYIKDPYKYYMYIKNRNVDSFSYCETYLNNHVVLNERIIDSLFKNKDHKSLKQSLELLNISSDMVYNLAGSKISMDLYNEIMDTK